MPTASFLLHPGSMGSVGLGDVEDNRSKSRSCASVVILVVVSIACLLVGKQPLARVATTLPGIVSTVSALPQAVPVSINLFAIIQIQLGQYFTQIYTAASAAESPAAAVLRNPLDLLFSKRRL
jgi:hypothetical protein